MDLVGLEAGDWQHNVAVLAGNFAHDGLDVWLDGWQYPIDPTGLREQPQCPQLLLGFDVLVVVRPQADNHRVGLDGCGVDVWLATDSGKTVFYSRSEFTRLSDGFRLYGRITLRND